MKSEYSLELEGRFNKSLEDLFDLSQKSETKDSLPYGKPMNLQPVLSSAEYLGITHVKTERTPQRNLEAVVKRYGALKQELRSVASEINMLNNLEHMKTEYVKKRDEVKTKSEMTDFEKLNKERVLKMSLKKVKDGISEMSGRIDKRMDGINSKILDLSNVRKAFERRHIEISGCLTNMKKGEPIPEAIAQKLKGASQTKIIKYKRDLSDGITLCEQIITMAREKKDSLTRSMWMGVPIIENKLAEKMELPKAINQGKGLSRDM